MRRARSKRWTAPQPGLPLKPGRCGTYTHDYKRNGTTTLFAALQLVEGRVIGQCYPRHRHQEFLKFLRRLDDEFPPGKDLHLILDNYGTHGHPQRSRPTSFVVPHIHPDFPLRHQDGFFSASGDGQPLILEQQRPEDNGGHGR